MSASRARRRFADIEDGQVHFWELGEASSALPVVMLHSSPGSARGLLPKARELATGRRVLAVDTPGNGDSTALALAEPDIAALAERLAAWTRTVGLERFDLYGSHTGASLAIELAIMFPDRVRRLVLDGVALFSPQEQADLLAHHAPQIEPDLHGGHIAFAWHFVRDAALFFPWNRTDAEHRRPTGLPDAVTLHENVLEVIKAIGTYHRSYRASIAYPHRERLALVPVPTLSVCAPDDMLLGYREEVAEIVPRGFWQEASDAGAVAEWLDGAVV